MKVSEFRNLIREEVRKATNEVVDITDPSKLKEILIEAYMTGAYQSIKVIGKYDEPKLKRDAEKFANFYVKK